ncbi:hypothetical protein [Fangia hongkongensis]|uniref:hypothetical protein n=2 Tax=Fangia hongkongensis TaxID=270495 RepID=UPI00037FA41A|nr:hypothetical protein [Fangia hongkongensis]
MSNVYKRSYFWSALVLVLVMMFSITHVYAGEDEQKSTPITISDVEKAQSEWAKGIVSIGKAYQDHKDYKEVTVELIEKLYAYNYEHGVVLFKPTKAAEVPFRPTKASALSYFIGGNKNFKEDKGFALQPWTKVVFHNSEMYFHNDLAIAMGEYDFTDTKGKVTTVEYTFGYVKDPKTGALKIVLHHSSLPFSG